MDWTEDAGMYKRFCEYKESIQYILGGPLNKETKAAKANYLMSWLAPRARDLLKGMKTDVSTTEAILKDLETWCKPKANSIASFRDLTNLKQDSLSLSEYITQVRNLFHLCNYPTCECDERCQCANKLQERILRDFILAGLNLPEGFKKCIAEGDNYTLDQTVKILVSEDAARRQVANLESKPSAPAEVHAIQPAWSKSQRHKSKGGYQAQQPQSQGQSQQRGGCTRCAAPQWHHRSVCKAIGQICYNCSGKDHFTYCCSKPKKQQPPKTAVRAIASQEQSHEVVDTAPDYTPAYFPATYTPPPPPTVPHHQIHTVPVCRLQQHRMTGEHIRPAWISEQSRDSPINQIDCEVDTGAGCNVLPMYKAAALFGPE